MKRLHIIGFVVVVALALSTASVAFAQDTVGLPGQVIGISTDVDGNTVVTVLLPDGTTQDFVFDETYDHPIVALLAEYFGTSVEELSQALTDATYNSQVVTGIVDNGDGTWTLTLADGTTAMISDADQAATIAAALAGLGVTVDQTTTDGDTPVTTYDLVSTGDEIQAYHDSGMGFGVLTKFYAIADRGDATVAELVDVFKVQHVGIGKIFKEYGGKPDINGVGHVRKALKEEQAGTESSIVSSQTQDDQQGNGNNGQGKGQLKEKNNNGKAKGKNK